MSCEKCDEKDKRIAELEGLVARMARSVDSVRLGTHGFIETAEQTRARILEFAKPDNYHICGFGRFRKPDGTG